ncbi:MAG: hypothetical protein NZT61_04000 [Deltaproteobacteria bacterium]|nr:hypothetical protein [Deltaproteobacteria bacterium]MCX7953087.1 hypothetical protein [Deltaproteobacteria bacterium]
MPTINTNYFRGSDVTFSQLTRAAEQNGRKIESLMNQLGQAVAKGDHSTASNLQLKLQREYAVFNLIQSVVSLLVEMLKRIGDSIGRLAR